MKILVVSDTHGNISSAIDIINNGKFDIIIHLGDHYHDAMRIESIVRHKVIAVVGNCDFSYEEEDKVLEVEGKRLFLTHGHRYKVKKSTKKLKKLIDENHYDMVMFGHSHRALIERYKGATIFNPGSISLPRDGAPSYGIIVIEKNSNIFSKIIRLI